MYRDRVNGYTTRTRGYLTEWEPKGCVCPMKKSNYAVVICSSLVIRSILNEYSCWFSLNFSKYSPSQLFSHKTILIRSFKWYPKLRKTVSLSTLTCWLNFSERKFLWQLKVVLTNTFYHQKWHQNSAQHQKFVHTR